MALAIVSVLFTIIPAHAASKYWSANGTTAGGDGTWDLSPNHWATAPGGPWNLAWVNANNDVAENSSGTANITLGANIVLGRLSQGAAW